MNEAVNSLASQEENTELLPLDAAERVVAYRFGGKSYRHFFRRITSADVECYFANVSPEVKQEEKGGITVVSEFDSAALALYRRAALRAEGDGFMTRDGRAAHELPTWPHCLLAKHSNHCIIAADLLVSAFAPGGEEFLDAEGVSVTLNGTWNQKPDDPGSMLLFKGLVHKFISPTAAHFRKIKRAQRRTRVVGGSRTGTTLMPSCWGVVSALYDELIESVEGYSAGGRALASKEEIVREMDAFHKNAAITALFPVFTEPDAGA